jgi:hypothetical protein
MFWLNFCKKTSSRFSKSTKFLSIISKNIFKIITSVPCLVFWCRNLPPKQKKNPTYMDHGACVCPSSVLHSDWGKVRSLPPLCRLSNILHTEQQESSTLVYEKNCSVLIMFSRKTPILSPKIGENRWKLWHNIDPRPDHFCRHNLSGLTYFMREIMSRTEIFFNARGPFLTSPPAPRGELGP